MKYNCTLCNYLTDDRKNFSHHKKTKKHLEKVNNQLISSKNLQKTPKTSETSESEQEGIYQCNFCKLKFTRADNLARHMKKSCVMNEINDVKIDSVLKEKELIQKQLEELKKEKEELKKDKEKQLEKIEKEKEELKKEKEKQLEKTEKQLEELKKEKDEEKKKLEEQLLYYRDVAYYKKDNDTNMTNLNFINKHYDDAPALEGPKDLHKLFNADKSANPDVYYANLASELGSHHRLNILHKVISDFIVKDYCKEDKSKQSVWNSDSSRLNYIVRECIQKEKIWIMDKSGQSLLKKVIKPIIEYIKPDLEEATKRVISYANKPNGITYMDMKDHQALLEIGNNIMNNTLQEDILKELTQHFNINQKLLLKDIKEKSKDLENKKDGIISKKGISNFDKNSEMNMIKDKEETKEDTNEKEESTIKDKLINSLKELDNKLNKLRKQEHKLDVDYKLEDDEKEEKYKIIEENKKIFKNQKKELKKLINSYDELENKKKEVEKEEEEITSDTESERELETKRQLQINKTMRKKKDINNKFITLEKEIKNILEKDKEKIIRQL